MILKHWREASTVILAVAVNGANSSSRSFNYKLLTVKRSEKSQFMPGGYVFPGGVKHSSDCSKDWLSLFKKFHVDESHLQNFRKLGENVPPLFQNEKYEIEKLISLRITAIRETFEETGILLCKTRDNLNNIDGSWVSYQSNQDLPQWRLRVQEHPEEFLNLCNHFDCLPDIWGLHLWSNWLTPRYENRKRFDTAFFVAALKDFPQSAPDETEVVKSSWLMPDVLINLCNNEEIWLPPPQFYEVARLLQFTDLGELLKFSNNRDTAGCERWMPERIRTSDGIVSLLPGDEMYPQDIDYVTLSGKYPQVSDTLTDLREQGKVHHRFEQVTEYGPLTIFTSNYVPKYGHILPIGEANKS